MAGFLSTAVVAVSVSVSYPAVTPAPTLWTTPSASTLASVIETWASDAGAARPQLPQDFASVKVGRISVKAPDLCTAVTRLVDAFRHASPHPRLVGCDRDSGQITLASE